MSDPQDDGYIIAVGRSLQERGGQLQFAEAEPIDEGFRVTAMLTAGVTVALQDEIAHGRAMALKLLLKGRSEI